ncbi:MAG: DNA starvation/stationary phase protection protein [Rhodospirillales bacterium]|nr:DNA starvation/stationary phase protection protein [Rhodospirillales bacterium]
MSKQVVDGLNKILADTFFIYFKTHSFHWNVEGPQFKSLHDLFMLQYTELWNATDEIAERIRTLGAYAPNSWAEMDKIASLQEVGQTPDAMEMVKMLADDNVAIANSMKTVLKAAQDADDEVTADLLIGRITIHEKAAWMLRSIGK